VSSDLSVCSFIGQAVDYFAIIMSDWRVDAVDRQKTYVRAAGALCRISSGQ